MTAHPNRCRKCRHAPGEIGSHWCYRNPASNGGHRQWIDQTTYDCFISILGCASFEPIEQEKKSLKDMGEFIEEHPIGGPLIRRQFGADRPCGYEGHI